jgi:hypothetical protein
MKTTWKQNYNEIKEAYKHSREAPKLHGEEVISFECRCQTPILDRYFTFNAPRCSSNAELTSHAIIQNRILKAIMENNDDAQISFKVN